MKFDTQFLFPSNFKIIFASNFYNIQNKTKTKKQKMCEGGVALSIYRKHKENAHDKNHRLKIVTQNKMRNMLKVGNIANIAGI